MSLQFNPKPGELCPALENALLRVVSPFLFTSLTLCSVIAATSSISTLFLIAICSQIWPKPSRKCHVEKWINTHSYIDTSTFFTLFPFPALFLRSFQSLTLYDSMLFLRRQSKYRARLESHMNICEFPSHPSNRPGKYFGDPFRSCRKGEINLFPELNFCNFRSFSPLISLWPLLRGLRHPTAFSHLVVTWSRTAKASRGQQQCFLGRSEIHRISWVSTVNFTVASCRIPISCVKWVFSGGCMIPEGVPTIRFWNSTKTKEMSRQGPELICLFNRHWWGEPRILFGRQSEMVGVPTSSRSPF